MVDVFHNHRLDIEDENRVIENNGGHFVISMSINPSEPMRYIFYNETPHPRGSHYYGIHVQDCLEGGKVMVSNAGAIENKPITAILPRHSSQILYSAHGRDFVNSTGHSAMEAIDGCSIDSSVRVIGRPYVCTMWVKDGIICVETSIGFIDPRDYSYEELKQQLSV